MPRKILIDKGKLAGMIREHTKKVINERSSINPENPVVEKLWRIELAYDNVLDYLGKCPKYDSSGRKI